MKSLHLRIRRVANALTAFTLFSLWFAASIGAVALPDGLGRIDSSRSSPVDQAAYRSESGRHKVLIERDRVQQLKSLAASATRTHDYGSFQVLELDRASADRLIASGAANNADAQNLLMLNTGTIDTTAPVAAALTRKSLEVGDEKQLHLVQFPGPIKPEWFSALEATGVKVVVAIPSNAYLVYGDRSSREKVAALAATGTAQWDGPYLSDYKVQPGAYESQRRSGEKSAIAPTAAPVSNRFEIQLVKDPVSNAATEARIASLAASAKIVFRYEILNYVNLLVELPEVMIADVAKRPDVISVAAYIEPKRNDERQNMILARNVSAASPIAPLAGNYLDILTGWGFTQSQFNSSGLVVDVADDGADRNPGSGDPGTIPQNANSGSEPVPVVMSPRHFVFYQSGSKTQASRFVYKGRWGTGSVADLGLGLSGHGQLNMSIIGGYVPDSFDTGNTRVHRDNEGFRFGLGVAPFVRMGNSVIFDPNFTTPNLPNMLNAAYASGARISSNSWGANSGGAYTANSQAYDALVRDSQAGTAGNQPMLVVFAAGNAGPTATTVGAPASAKNIITVGAAEGVRSHSAANGGNAGNTTGADGCGTPDTDANNANDVAPFSSRGPTADGRVKPDIMAPGTHITGISYVAASADALTPPNNNGLADAGFRADGVCGMPSSSTVPANRFFPVSSGQQWYTTSSGTSHSTPAVAGAAALIYQQFINNPGYLASHRTPSGAAAPSPALVKAYLTNAASYMDGVSANDNLPSNSQGMGLANLGRAFDGVQRIIRDQVPSDRFTASGQGRSFFATVSSATAPVRVTLAYTDAPGATSGNAYVNNLDLRVIVGGNLYLGNVFTGATSVVGGAADSRNNLESVFLPAGLPVGTEILIQVRATNIAGPADPTVIGNNQDFALVIYNAEPSAGSALLSLGNVTLTGNNAILEPNECNDLTLPLTNEGTVAATGVSATLSTSSSGVDIVQDNSAYPDLAANGATANNTQTYKVSTNTSLACGTVVNFTQTVAFSGGTSPATMNFTRTVGQPSDPNYTFTSSSGATISTGGTLVPGSANDDALVSISAPFAFSVYGTNVASGATIRLSTNGVVFIAPSGGSSSESNSALPAAAFTANVPALIPYWDDLDMRTTVTTGGGIFSEVTGSAPNRVWKLEWRARPFVSGQAVGAPSTNFAVYLNEGTENFSYVYAATGAGAALDGAAATVGVQATNAGTNFTQFSSNTASLSAGLRLNAARAPGVCNAGSGVCAPTCSLDINGDGGVNASDDALLLLRYLLGLRGSALVANITLGAARPNAGAVESFIGAGGAYDVFRRPALSPSATRDALVLLRLMLSVPDTELLNSISVPSTAVQATAAAIRRNVNARCGTSY